MKIAIIGDRGIPARYSGFSTLVEELAVRLVKDHSMQVTVYCRKPYYEDYPPSYKGVECVYLPSPGGKNFESIVHSNLSFLQASLCSYDLVFVVDPGNAPFALPLFIRSIPIVFHTDGLGWQRKKWSRIQQCYYKWSEWVCAKVSDALVTDSRAIQRYYEKEYKAHSSFIPYSGVVGETPDDTCLEQFGFVNNGYYLVVARIEPENNVDLIIREYLRADSKLPLVVVGGAHHNSQYAQETLSVKSDRVHCVGAIFESKTLNGLYKNCYAYIHGHEVGGTNPSLLRAMNAGAACIPINVPYHREVLDREAIYFEKTVGDLSSKIALLDTLPDRVDEMGKMAAWRSDNLYRWDAVASGYSQVFLKQ